MGADLQLFAFPLSLLAAAAVVLAILLYPKKCPRKLSVAVLLILAVLFALLGSFRKGSFSPLWLSPFLLAAIFLSGLAARDAFKGKRPLSESLSHLGLCILLGSSFFCAPDCTRTAIVLGKDSPSHISEDSVPLPFELCLKEVHTDFYDDGASPKQYTATLTLDSKTRTVSVNHPVLHRGWLMYLSDFDRAEGSAALILLVKDPSIPGVLLGMIMLLAAAVLSLKRSWKSRWSLVVVLLLAVIFTLVSVSRIRFATLPPALRSFWFAPHLMVYMLAYACLALSLICSLAGLSERFKKASRLSRGLLHTSSALIIIGIIFGSVWAQLSWGDYWAWDAKECWAAATWILTLCAMHLKPSGSRKALIVFTMLAFAAMQMTWYGVNYLPSAGSSMHSYNVTDVQDNNTNKINQ